MANEILSVEGQLVGIPLQEYTAGPGIVVDNVNKTIKVADDYIVSQLDTYTVSGTSSNTSTTKTINKPGYNLLSITMRNATGWGGTPVALLGNITGGDESVTAAIWYKNNQTTSMQLTVETIWIKKGV